MSKNQQDNIEPAKKLAETAGRRRPGQARSDAPVRPPPPTHNHTLPAGLSLRSRLIRLLHARVFRNHWGAWCFLVAGLTVTVLTSLYIKTSVESAAQREFDFACNGIRIDIVARLEAAAQILRSGAALFDAAETVSREGWRTFTRHLQIEQYLPGIQGLGFALLVPREQLDQHVQAIRDEGFPEYQVRPAGERDSYSSIIYLEPFSDRNLRAFGYDMLSEPVRRTAMEWARDENTAALSGKVILVQETGQDVQAGVLMYVPVSRHGLPIETIEQRRAAIQGWVYSPYRMTDLMHGTLGHWDVKQTGKQISLQVYDGDVLSSDTLLYDSQGATDRAPASTALIARLTPVDFAGRRWTLRFTEPGGPVSLADYGKAWLVLFGGTMGTLLLFGLMLWRQQRIRIYWEKAEAGEVLLASELRYRRLFEAARDGVLILDAETGVVVDVNPYLIELLGVPRDVFLGRKVWELGFFKDLIANEANFSELQEKGYVRYEGMAMEGPDGKRHEVEFVSNVYLVNQQRVIQCNIRDISERVKAAADLAEARGLLQAALDCSSAGIAIADAPSGQLRYVNRAGLLIRGADEAEVVTDIDINKYVASWKLLDLDGTPLKTDQVPLARAVLFGETSKREFLIRRDEHEDRIVLANAAPIRNTKNKVIAGIVVFVDLTENKRAEKQIHILNMELEQRVAERTAQLDAANKELEAFSYSVSHDLRAPLRHVQGYVDMLGREAEGRLSEQGRHYMKTIADASLEMGVLIDDLLAFSRMGRVDMAETRVNLDTLVQDSLHILEPATRGRNIVWKIPPLPVVQADPAMLRLVLDNLLGNAVKFTRPRDPAHIEMGCAGTEDGRVILFVRDNGVGFDPQYGHKLFGVFQRLHTTEQFEGTGIGLANVRRIITRHGGRTWAEGKLNEGATFYFTLKTAQ